MSEISCADLDLKYLYVPHTNRNFSCLGYDVNNMKGFLLMCNSQTNVA